LIFYHYFTEEFSAKLFEWCLVFEDVTDAVAPVTILVAPFPLVVALAAMSVWHQPPSDLRISATIASNRASYMGNLLFEASLALS
jgi:hypothetical protein